MLADMNPLSNPERLARWYIELFSRGLIDERGLISRLIRDQRLFRLWPEETIGEAFEPEGRVPSLLRRQGE